MNIIFLGPQSSGKGTQAALLSKALDIPVVTTGNILRNRKKIDDEKGRLIASLIDKGHFVPDDLIDGIVREELQKKDYAKGVILDGYPRNEHQAKELEKYLEINKAIFLDVPDGIVMQRMLARRICENCGENYNLDSKPPKKEGVCDICGGKLILRHDDTKEAIAVRLNTYHEKTKPLIDYYKTQNKLLHIDGKGTIEEVCRDIKKALK